MRHDLNIQSVNIENAGRKSSFSKVFSNVARRMSNFVNDENFVYRIVVSKNASSIHKVIAYKNIGSDAQLSDDALAAQVLENGCTVVIFLHDQSIVRGKIIWQDDKIWEIGVIEWTYFDNKILATMQGDSLQSKLARIVELGSDIFVRYRSVIAPAKLVYAGQSGAIVTTALPVDVGNEIQLHNREQRPICGVIKWQCMNLAGLEFQRPMSSAERMGWLA